MSFLPFFLTHCLSLASRGVESFTSLQNTPLQKVLLKKKRAGGAGAFPGCPVVKTLHFHFYGLGFDPWLGIYDPACHAVKKKKKGAAEYRTTHWLSTQTSHLGCPVPLQTGLSISCLLPLHHKTKGRKMNLLFPSHHTSSFSQCLSSSILG